LTKWPYAYVDEAYIITAPGTGAEYCDQFVCLWVCLSVCLGVSVSVYVFVCLSVRKHISETAGPI